MRLAIVLLLACAPVAAQAPIAASINPVKASPIAAGTFVGVERHFNDQLSRLFDLNEPLDLLGLTRGVYLEGFGVVFTGELSLIRTPALTPFSQTIPKEVIDRTRLKKIERLPFLKAAMKDMMKTAGRTFIQIPDSQQVVIAIRFLYEPWEDRNGMPSQILMRADRKNAMAGEFKTEVQ